MMLEEIIIHSLEKAVNAVYGVEPQKEMLQVQATRKEFEGDLTAVMFPLLKLSRKSPEQTGQAIGEWMLANESRIESFQVIKGFLNLKMSSEYWKDQLREIERSREYGFASDSGKTIVIEFSSPNTNILLGIPDTAHSAPLMIVLAISILLLGSQTIPFQFPEILIKLSSVISL